MGTSYVRQSSMADGDTITAALFNDEFNRLLTAFSYASSSTTGHQHDGTAGEGGNIATIGDQDFLNKLAADSTNNRWGFFVEVSSSAVEQIRIQDGAIVPVTDNDIDLGTSSLEFKDAYFDGTVTTDALVADTADINGGTVDGATIGASSATTIVGTTITANTAFVPDASDGAALGTSALEFSDLYLADGAVVYFGDDQDVSLTHVADTGILLSSTDQLQFGDSGTYIHQSADGVLDLVSDTEIEINATTIDINGAVDVSGNLSVGGSLDVTGTIDLSDSDFTNAGDIQLDSITGDGDTNTSITFSGSDVITITAGGETQITFNNGSILPTTDNDIDLGSSSYEFKDAYFDGTVTSDAFAGPLTGDVTGNVSGTAATVTTAAQSNITSLGTLTTLTVDNVIINGSTIGHTSDTDLMTVASGVLTVAGEVSLTTLDIGGTNVTSTAAELNYSDTGAAVGTVVASKVVTVDSNKDVSSFRNITLTGELDAATLDISGNADIDGTTNLDAVDIDGVVQIDGATTFGVDDTGVDVKFFGATSGAYLLWDESADKLLTAGGTVVDIVKDKLLIGGTAVTTTAAELNILDGKSFLDEDDLSSDSATAIASQQSIKAYVDGTGGSMSSFILEDDDGTEVSISDSEEVKFIGSGITTNWTDTTPGSDGDPFDLTFTVDAAQTGITSIYATDLIMGEDSQTAIDFGTANEIDFKVDNAARLTLTTGALYPVTDNQIDLGTSSLEFKDAFFDGTVTADAFAGPLTGNVTGNASGTALTVTQAAQSAITSLGTLTTLTVDNVIINGTTIGHTSDTDLMTLADGIVTVAGEVSLTTLDIGGTNVTSTAAELNILDGVTSTAAELNALDGITAVVGELNALDIGSTAVGTAVASKAVILDSNKDYTGIRNLTITGELDAATLDVSGNVDIDGTLEADGITSNSVAVKVGGKETIWVPAAAMYPNTTNGCADIAQVELSNGPELKCLDFATGADDFAQFTVAFPKSWNEGTVTFQAFWTVTGTNTGTVAWALSGGSMANDASINTAFGTAVVATALAHSGTSNDMMVSAESGAVTIANAAVNTVTFFEVFRDVSADNQSGDARLLGLKLFFTTDAANDA